MCTYMRVNIFVEIFREQILKDVKLMKRDGNRVYRDCSLELIQFPKVFR